ncbi:tripartite tricarboxylate transporter permease [bacterium LRH843]|nr:tripartite tricarboxylate transporter permease [bacterium LRH843]
MDIYLVALQSIFQPLTILLILLGTLGGVILGAMPGLNGPIGVALLLPFTFSLDPASGLLMLGGIYMGASYGGAISGILLNTPGTAEAACTALEGYPLAKQGRAKEALYYAVLSSVIGGLIGVIALILFTPYLASFALKFGSPEMFLIALAGLAVVGSLTGKSLAKGLFAACLGILISMVGPDIMSGVDRFTFGFHSLRNGIPLIPVIIGLFAISEMIIQSNRKKGHITDAPFQDTSVVHVLKSIIKKPMLVLKSSVLGTIIGILPGAGGAIASFIAYGEAKRASKRKDLFGKGNVEGIVASESSNNSAVGGSLIPLLALGIPGSATAAIIYGAITIHGLIPGPRLFVNNPDIAYTFMIGMILTVVIMAIIGILGVPIFTKILKVNLIYIIPVVLVFCLFGAYSLRNSLLDVLIAIIFGALGVVFRKFSIPTPPIVLGIILGPLAELNLRQSLTFATAKGTSIFEYIFFRPLSIMIFILLLIIIYASVKNIKES